MSRTCLINVGIGLWYSKGSDRLKASLEAHAFPGDIRIWKNEWPPGGFPRDCIYNAKAAAFQQAILEGYNTLLWADASFYAINKVEPLLDWINTHGYFLAQSGYKASETCSDACLKYFHCDRDTADTYPDSATGLFGVNLSNARAKEFIERWIKAGKDGTFRGSRHHDKQSKDRRFKFHRQDQSAASIIAGQMKLKLNDLINFAAFAWDSPEGKIFISRGM